MITSRSHDAPQASSGHIPVMLEEVLGALHPRDGGVYVDGTFGAGGYTRAILDAAHCTVAAIDRDPEAYARAVGMAKDCKGRLIPLHGRFGDMKELLNAQNIAQVNGIVLDIGISSIQLSAAERGFSFQKDGPLDMRMSKEGPSAADIVNTASEKDIAHIIYTYGEERASRQIAKKIVAARAQAPIKTTLQLADIIHSVLPQKPQLRTDTATKTFQALRIHVNDEMGELERALDAAEGLLSPEGRLVVVTFHSLEDWRVKNFLKQRAGAMGNASRHLPARPDAPPPTFTVAESGGRKASPAETGINPRARSARLRYGIRTASPVWKAVSGEEGARHA
ncbi:MAG: 16S rRNA (cytosine(1402)-N(4))-methyltransferase RsmH [Alphaproteobacteria bacterium]|nr:16S rRNA (cytosine(1402)-N(4))-methyltransferase RsmH [Alphaproteobacteria bacterium]MDE2337074.1 16S rRNA (cytosine(1402)-N(4))-methyltransferase RsmH [Alphaproteobacteria bacterium]